MNRKNTNTDVVITILFGVVFFNVLFGIGAVLFDFTDMVGNFMLETGIYAGINIIMCVGAVFYEKLVQRFWMTKNAKDADEGQYQLMKCSAGYYMILVLDILFGILILMMLLTAPREELIQIWEARDRIPLISAIILFSVMNGCFLYYTNRKVFYSRYRIRVVNFGKAEEVLWSQVRKIVYCRKKGKGRVHIETVDKAITLKEEFYTDGWGEFLMWGEEMAEEYRFPWLCEYYKF